MPYILNWVEKFWDFIQANLTLQTAQGCLCNVSLSDPVHLAYHLWSQPEQKRRAEVKNKQTQTHYWNISELRSLAKGQETF